MAAGVLRNAIKQKFPGHYIQQRHSFSDRFTKTPATNNITSPSHYNNYSQQSKAYYSRFPQSIYRKAKEVDFSGPVNVISTPFLSKSGLVGWYLNMIKTRPILTKSITSALIYTVADFSSQKIVSPSSEPYDVVRTLRMAGYGMLILGPSLHFWFNFVSKALPKRDLFTTMTKIVMGQTLYGPLMTVVFFSVNASLQGENGEEIVARLKRDLVPTMISGVMYWPLCDFVTFKFIPVQLQPLVSNSFSYLWTVYMTYMASLDKAAPFYRLQGNCKKQNLGAFKFCRLKPFSHVYHCLRAISCYDTETVNIALFLSSSIKFINNSIIVTVQWTNNSDADYRIHPSNLQTLLAVSGSLGASLGIIALCHIYRGQSKGYLSLSCTQIGGPSHPVTPVPTISSQETAANEWTESLVNVDEVDAKLGKKPSKSDGKRAKKALGNSATQV
ncbi:hypothetical protein POM88_014180 [Heracleum sosnowskyi]|uniref:PXMP2/4 family protein 4 n=1 Tax=Heracleum sosnowskyi TaxID=360622 RepID=A0AAD8IZX1_9APIA|nr:hypothetical protein POM88_014180 [Heracleum sosnowskyi]